MGVTISCHVLGWSPMAKLATAEAGVLAPYVNFLAERGVASARLLDRCNLSLEMVRAGAGKVSKFQGYQFLESSAREEGLSDLGFRVGEIEGLGAIGDFEGLARRAATLKEAVAILDAHFSFWVGDNRLWLESDGDHVWLLNGSSDGLHKMRHIANQCGVMALVALVREAAGSCWRPTRVRIGARPSRLHESFDALHEAEAELASDVIGVRFPVEFLALQVSDSPSPSPAPEGVTIAPPPQEFSLALETILDAQMRLRTPPTATQAAAIAGISRRTLHRRLQEEGLTFQSLLDRVRFKLARDRIRYEPGISTRALAKELHFGSASSFVRAFRRIAGMTPGEFGRRLR